MRRSMLPVAVMVLAIAGCGDDTTEPPGPAGNVRFDDLRVGQRSHYLFFACNGYGSPDIATHTYAPDTLLLTVVSRDPQVGFWITEELTPGSASRHGATNVADPDSVYMYRLVAGHDSLFVHTPGGIFLGSGSRIFVARTHGFPLAPVAMPVTTFAGWQPDLPYHDTLATAFVPTHSQHGGEYDALNVLQDNTAMQTDGPGFLFAYSGAHGLVRWAYYSWWTQAGTGWDLLPHR